MGGVSGQAAGLAVGAAVGSVVPGVGTVVGASVGGAIGGLAQNLLTSGTQEEIEVAALKLNQDQAHAAASDKAAMHATNFRQSLASQAAISVMRGGGGSLASQFGSQGFRTFEQDQRAIQLGQAVSDVGSSLGRADISARKEARDTKAVGTALTAFDAINLNI